MCRWRGRDPDTARRGQYTQPSSRVLTAVAPAHRATTTLAGVTITCGSRAAAVATAVAGDLCYFDRPFEQPNRGSTR